MLCGTNNNPHNTPHIHSGYVREHPEIFHIILYILHNIIMVLNNVMCKIQEQHYNILDEGVYQLLSCLSKIQQSHYKFTMSMSEVHPLESS